MTETQHTGNGHLQDTTTAVCCTCFGFGIFNRGLPESSPLIPSDEPDGLQKTAPAESAPIPTQIFHDPHESEDKGRDRQEERDLVFFDAVESQLEEDHYPVITTAYISKSQNASMKKPETMLRDANDWSAALFEDARSNPAIGEGIDENGRVRLSSEPQQQSISPSTPEHDSLMRTQSSDSLRTSSRRLSAFSIFRRNSFGEKSTEDADVSSLLAAERGYPGQLTQRELAQCILFYREIQKRKGNLLDIVYSLKGIEEEPYAICRFMRAAKFNAQAMLNKLENNQDHWEEAKANEFYRDIDSVLGVPLVLFLQHFPYFYHGNAKNGCPVNYFRAGKLETEALLSMVSPESSYQYFWHVFYYTFREQMVRAKQRNPDFARCESINVVDLKGLSSNQLTTEAVECLRGAARIAEFFPETLHCMVIMNAPTWFAMAWKIIKGFLDQRTSKKIEVYVSAEKGRRRLAELVDESEIPSDFGGTSPSLDDSIRARCRRPGENRDFYSTLVHIKKTEMKKAEMLYVLKQGESARVRVYTRSTTGAMVSVTCQGKLVGQAKKIYRPNQNVYTPAVGTEKPMPFLTEVHDNIQGPGKLAVEVKGMADTEPNRRLPHGNFLIAVEVRKV